MRAKWILVIEDNIPLAMGLETCLKSHGFEVQRALDGEEALVACQQRLPDLVVTDLLMSNMDGRTFLQHLRALPGGDAVPVIVISGMVDATIVQDIKDLGVEKVLYKPFDLDEFVQTIRASLAA